MFLAWRQLRIMQRKISEREDKRNNNNEVVLSYQREKLENEVYAANDKLTATYVRFEDVNHLFITKPDEPIAHPAS